jgi:hypothetical protein
VNKAFFGSAGAAVMLFARVAAAQDQPAQPPTPPAPAGETPPPTQPPPPSTGTTNEASVSVDSTVLSKKEWYGGQIIIADAVGLAIIGLAAGISAGVDDVGTNAAGIMAPGVASYVFTSPIIHTLHNNTKGGARSMVARMLLPAAGAAVGGLVGAIATGNDHKSPLNESSGLFWGGVIGASVGAVATTVIDAVAWAQKDTAQGEDTNAPPPPPTGIRLAPTVAATPVGGMAGLGGVF